MSDKKLSKNHKKHQIKAQLSGCLNLLRTNINNAIDERVNELTKDDASLDINNFTISDEIQNQFLKKL